MNNENAVFSCRTQQFTTTTNRGVDHSHRRACAPGRALGGAKVVLEIDEQQCHVFRRETGGEIALQRPNGLDGQPANLVGRTNSKFVAVRNGKDAHAIDERSWSLTHQKDAANPVRAQQLVQCCRKVDTIGVASSTEFPALRSCENSAAIRRTRHGGTHPWPVLSFNKFHVEHEPISDSAILPQAVLSTLLVAANKQQTSTRRQITHWSRSS
jgi:hypothetical protein